MDRRMREVLSKAYGVGKYEKRISDWQDKKSVMAKNIEEVMDRGTVDQETLEIMLEMLDRTKVVKRSMKDHIGD